MVTRFIIVIILKCMCALLLSRVWLCNPMDCNPPGSFVHGSSSGKNTGVGWHSLLRGIFPIQGLNPGLPHCRWILYDLCHQGSSWILEWVACPFSRRSSWPKNRTVVSCTAGKFFSSWATREALWNVEKYQITVLIKCRSIILQKTNKPNHRKRDQICSYQRWGSLMKLVQKVQTSSYKMNQY